MSAEPADFSMKLIAELEVLAAIVREPLTIVEVLSPVVVSKVILAAVPLVLAAKISAPLWLMSLFEVKVIFEPLAPLILPIW